MKKLLAASMMIFAMVASASAQEGKKASAKKLTPVSATAAPSAEQKAFNQKRLEQKKAANTAGKAVKVSSPKQEFVQ